jgi:hypothetical protein
MLSGNVAAWLLGIPRAGGYLILVVASALTISGSMTALTRV